MVAEHRDGGENKIRCTSIHTYTKAVSQWRQSWKNTKISFTMKRKNGPVRHIPSEKCLWARLDKTESIFLLESIFMIQCSHKEIHTGNQITLVESEIVLSDFF